MEKYEIIKEMLHGFDYMAYFEANIESKIALLLQITDKLLNDEKEKKRFLDECLRLTKAYIMALPN